MRRPWRTAAGGWRTETRDPHAHHHHESSDRLFSGFFYDAVVQHVTYVTDFVELVELYTLHGERHPAIFRHGRRSCAATFQITREDLAIIDICMAFFGSIALFFHACPRVVTLTTLQTAGMFVCAHLHLAVRTVQATPDSNRCSL